MSLVNIAEEGNNDAHYRYKRELLRLKVEGRGNGIKTVITNMLKVAESLGVPPEYPTKYFGLECAAQSKYDKKTERAVVNGKFELREMEQTLQNFIKKFVLCYKCKLPECTYEITKSEELKMNCKACGAIHTVSPGEKLVTYIVKHPPPQRPQKGSADTEQQQQQLQQQQQKKLKKQQQQQFEEINEDELEWSEDTSEEAVKRRRELEGLSSNIDALTASTSSSSAAASASGKKSKTSEDNEEAVEQEEEDGEISPVQVLKKFVGLKGTDNLPLLYAAIKKIQSEYGLGDREVVCLMYEALFTAEDIYKHEIAHFGGLFRKFVKTSATAQKILLGYTEELVSKNMDTLLPHVSEVLMEFYQQDLITEDVVNEWAQSKKKSKFVKSTNTLQKIKAASVPFCQWLTVA